MILEKLAERHKEWELMSRKVAGDKWDDTLQNAYLKVYSQYEKGNFIIEDKEPGQVAMYMYLTIRSVFLNSLEKEQLSIEELEIEEQPEETDDLPCLNDLREMLNNQSWYDRMVFEVHFFDRTTSIEKLSQDSGIQVSSLYYTISKVKKELQEQWAKKKRNLL